MKIIEKIVQNSDAIASIRRDIHAHPELRYEEFRTSELVAAQLASWGIEVHRGLGGTGLVGVVKKGSSSRAVGLRADMDALPIEERNTFSHASKNVGKMHACGHDGHVAMLLAAAQYLQSDAQFDGTVYLIFQPAEEGGGGAKAMIKDGLFERFPMQAVFALHNWPGLAQGDIAVSPGPVMASSNEFAITVRGKGGHAALPHLALDPVPVACQIVQALQTVVTRNKKPIDPAVISVTQLQAGEATNVIADTCTMQGTVRTFGLEVLDMIEQRMGQLAQYICQAYEMECQYVFKRNYPPTINHAAQAQFCAQVAKQMLGAARVHTQEPTMGAEDFAYMLQVCAGAYIFIGNGQGEHRGAGHDAGPCTLHNPHFDFNDALIPIGASYWVHLVEQSLPK